MRLFRARNTVRGTGFWVIAESRQDVALLVVYAGKASEQRDVLVIGDYTSQYLETTDFALVEEQGLYDLKVVRGERRWIGIS